MKFEGIKPRAALSAFVAVAVMVGLGAGPAAGAEAQDLHSLDKATAQAAVEKWADLQCSRMTCPNYQVVKIRLTGQKRALGLVRFDLKNEELGETSCLDKVRIWIARGGRAVRISRADCPFLTTQVAGSIALDAARAECAATEAACRYFGYFDLGRTLIGQGPSGFNGTIYFEAVTDTGETLRCEREILIEMQRDSTVEYRLPGDVTCRETSVS